jgi:hypothetical protein
VLLLLEAAGTVGGALSFTNPSLSSCLGGGGDDASCNGTDDIAGSQEAREAHSLWLLWESGWAVCMAMMRFMWMRFWWT